jgi:glucose-1-phosphate cytidylyltransferase
MRAAKFMGGPGRLGTGMKVVILAGGQGSRLSEETTTRPKPMVELGGKPILWHIMKLYSQHGLHEFIICLGYRGYLIKEYFANYFLHTSDVTIDMRNNRMDVHQNSAEPWRVTLIDTGEHTQTGGRLGRVRDHVGDETFCFTYGDGVSDVDIPRLIDFHRDSGMRATVTAVQPPGRFGHLEIEEGRITAFREKAESAWVNGGFFVLEPAVFELVEGDATVWELGPMEQLARSGQLGAYRHTGFWQPMDTLRDKMMLEDLWARGRAPWKVWT